MLNIDRISTLFTLFSDLPDESLPTWRGTLENAAASIVKRLRDGVDTRAEMERLCMAAAGLAYCEWLMLGGSGISNADEIRVGGIALKQSSSSNQNERDALEMREYFLSQAADLLIPESFVFMGVQS